MKWKTKNNIIQLKDYTPSRDETTQQLREKVMQSYQKLVEMAQIHAAKGDKESQEFLKKVDEIQKQYFGDDYESVQVTQPQKG